MHDEFWQTTGVEYTLERDDVHVWRCFVHESLSALAKLEALLQPDERERADRFHFQQDRERFVVARGVLRTILGAYLRQPPAELTFTYTDKGKPGLATADELQFNLAHSGDLVLLALNLGRPLGVDVEYMRPDLDTNAIAHRFFSSEEISHLATIPNQRQRRAFYNTWSRKEAFLKATGDGLSFPLNQFSVSLDPVHAGEVRFASGVPADGLSWTIQHLTPHPAYAGAVAVAGRHWSLQGHHWTPSMDAA